MTEQRKEYLNKPSVRERVRLLGRERARKYRATPEINQRIKIQRDARLKTKKRAVHKFSRPQSSKIYREVIIYFLIDRDGINCGFCGKPVDIPTVTIDHITPKFFGGQHRMNNLRLAHNSCNFSAGGKLRRKY